LPEWVSARPDLFTEELAQVVRLTKLGEEKIHRKLIQDRIFDDAIPWKD
jgi:hypothetical protein